MALSTLAVDASGNDLRSSHSQVEVISVDTANDRSSCAVKIKDKASIASLQLRRSRSSG